MRRSGKRNEAAICVHLLRDYRTVALANKMARTAWALLVHGGTYRAPELAQAA
jgi:hypothetical protein